MGVIDEIAAERKRQIDEEGWTPEHDDEEHNRGELGFAAACYAAPEVIYQRIRLQAGDGYVDAWPWPGDFWKLTEEMKKGKSRHRQLVIAAALIVAEIERLQREAPPKEQP